MKALQEDHCVLGEGVAGEAVGPGLRVDTQVDMPFPWAVAVNKARAWFGLHVQRYRLTGHGELSLSTGLQCLAGPISF